jgi:hypothetical protein
MPRVCRLRDCLGFALTQTLNEEDDMKRRNPLLPLIERRAPLLAIEAALSAGADANDVEIMQALEGIPYNDPWLVPVLALPAVADAWHYRSDADQAALDLSGAIEHGDINLAAAALATMREAGDTADMLADDLTFLGEAMACRAPEAIIRLLLGNGTDPDGFSGDARDELAKLPEDTWRATVEGLFANAPVQVLRADALRSEKEVLETPVSSGLSRTPALKRLNP